MKTPFFLLLLNLFGFALMANAQSCEVGMESFGDYDLEGKQFVVRSMFEDTKESDLEFQQYADYLKSYLIYKGAIPTDSVDTADVQIMLGYGINDSGTRVSASFSSGVRFGDLFWTSTSIQSLDNYARYIYLAAYSNQLVDGELEMLWKAKIMSMGSSGGLSEVFPMMIYAARNYLGRPTDGQITKFVYRDASTYYQPEAYEELCNTFLYDFVKNGIFLKYKPYRHVSSVGNANAQAKQITVDMVILSADKLTVLFRAPQYTGNLHKTIYMEQNGQEYLKTDASPMRVGTLDGYKYIGAHFYISDFDPTQPFSIRDRQKANRSMAWEEIVLQH